MSYTISLFEAKLQCQKIEINKYLVCDTEKQPGCDWLLFRKQLPIAVELQPDKVWQSTGLVPARLEYFVWEQVL